jgi:predicted component of type VI protein secretion system
MLWWGNTLRNSSQESNDLVEQIVDLIPNNISGVSRHKLPYLPEAVTSFADSHCLELHHISHVVRKAL